MVDEVKHGMRFNENEFNEILEAIDILAKHKLKSSEIVGMYENRTIHPKNLKRRLIFPSSLGIDKLDGFVTGTKEEYTAISNACRELVPMNLSPAFLLTVYECAVDEHDIKSCKE